jgi:C-terminal processing protease CtpA/Prc
LALREEPDDEALREGLERGCFSGLELREGPLTLDALEEGASGLEVVAVVENSPAHAAGIELGDLLCAAAPEGTSPQALRFPSEWRALELEQPPGTSLELLLDRAGVLQRRSLLLEPRVAAAERSPALRLREEERVGMVVRTASEVEARRAGLANGAGAVVVGLSAASPWRAAGVRYRDLIVAADGQRIAHPLVLLDAIRTAPRGASLRLTILREGESLEVSAPLSRRAREMHSVSLPLVWSYENDGTRKTTSALLGLYRHERTRAAWRLRFLWLFSFSGGDADRLEELDG